MTTKEFDIIYKKYWWLVFRFARNRLNGDNYNAEEVTAHVFMKLWETQPEFNTEESIRIWLIVSAKRRAIDLKIQIGHYHHEVINEYDIVDHNELESYAIDRDVLNQVLKIVKTFVEREQQIFDLHFLKGIPSSEIAAILKTKPRTVWNYIFSIRNKLKSQIKKGR